MVQALLVNETARAPFSEPLFMDPCGGTAWLLFTNIVTMKLHLRTLDLVLNVNEHEWKNCILCNFASFLNLADEKCFMCLFASRSREEVLVGCWFSPFNNKQLLFQNLVCCYL